MNQSKLKTGINTVRAWVRVILLISSIVLYLCLFFIMLPFKRDSLNWGLRLRWSWMKVAHAILGIRLQLKGNIPNFPAIIACNHQSALDPLIPMRYLSLFPVGKYEIRGYPLIGFAAEKTGIIFVKRDLRNHRRAVRKKIAEYLKMGRSILLFPEGTVNLGNNVLPFRRGAFQSAINTDKPVVPTSIQYGHPDDIWQQKDGLMDHIKKQCGKRTTEVTLHFGEPIYETEAESLASATELAILNQLSA